MIKLIGAVFVCLSLTEVALAATKKCTYSFESSKTAVEWTAFKTTKKVPVKGQFTKFTASGATGADSALTLMQGLSFSIDTHSVSTKNPERDKTLVKHFFTKILGSRFIRGFVEKTSCEKGKKGSCSFHVRIAMNGTSQLVPMAYQINKSGEISAKGRIDMLDFAMNPAFKSISKACFQLHKGKDGISKTWSDVEIQLKTTPICS